MNEPNHDRDDDPMDALVRDLDAAAVPAGFADRVVDAHLQKRRRRRLLATAAAGVGALGAVAAAFAFVIVGGVGGGAETSSGDVAAGRERRSVNLGAHVVAVVEPGAEVIYEAGRDGVAVVQPRGSAFYRVERGTPTTVHTGGGDVVVHGTCFSVDVAPASFATPQENPMHIATKPLSKTLAAAAAGALVGAVVTVVVFEGEVAVANDKGALTLHAGDRAVASAEQAPALRAPPPPLELTRLRAERDRLAAALDAAQAASGGDVQKLLAENRALREKLTSADEELALADADRQAKEGTELPFPKDLPPRFTQQELLAAFSTAIKQAGIEGDVTHIDCDEYPCIVYGDVKVSSDLDATKISEKMKDAPAFAPYKDDEDNSSWWRSLKKNPQTGETEDETHFGIALWPKSDDDGDGESDDSDAVGKRIGFRNQEMWDAMKPHAH